MERKYYDLSPAQKILLYSQTYTMHKQVNNICTSVLVDQELDFDILKKSILKAYERNDSFRIRLVKVDKETKQYFAEYEEPVIEYLDFRGKSFEEMEKKLYKIAKKRITHFEKPLSKIYMMHSYDGRCGIFFGVSHMVMDSWAISTFFKDVLSIYQAISNGSDMPKPLASCEELLIDDLNYRNTEAYKRDREYFEELFYNADEPIFNHINGPGELEKFRKKKKDSNLRYGSVVALRTKGKNIMLPFSKELVEKMEAYCATNKVTMQSMVLLVYRSYLSKVNNKEKDISIYSVVARRGTLKEKNSGGTRVHFMPFRTIIQENNTFKEACEIIGEQQSAIYRHASFNPLEARGMMSKPFNAPRTGTYCFSAFTFQPVKLAIGNDINLETKWYGNGAAPQPIYITIMDGDGAGGLKFYYEYQIHNVSFETIKKLHSYMMKAIEMGISNDEITIDDLLEIEPS